MKTLSAILCLTLVAPFAFGQATTGCPVMSFSAATNVATLEFAKCPGSMPANVAVGADATVTIGATTIPSKVVDVTNVQIGPVTSKTITVQPANASGTRNFQAGDAAEYSGDTASVTFGTATIPVTLATPVSHSEQKVHVGQDSTADQSSGSSAFRFQYNGAYVVFPPSGNAAKRWLDRGVQQEYTLSIDTTNQSGTSFTDEANAAAGVYLPRFSAGMFLNRARFGFQGSYSRAVHVDNHLFDGKLLFEAWLPFFQAQTIFSKNRYAAPPLSLNVGWGYRDRNSANADKSGTVFDGTVAYHLYLMDQYRIDLAERTVVSSAETPKTQHTWKASALMSPKVGSAFSAVVSVENGHSGPVFTKLRQYFLGIGFERLFDSK